MQSAAPVQAATVDAFGTLVHLADPVPRLRAALREAGVEATPEATAAAFRAEVQHYRPRSHTGRDQGSLAALRHDCVRVFLDELGSSLAPAVFVDDFIAALEFEVLPGARSALEELRALGLKLACVANWDIGLHAELARLGVTEVFDAVLTSADVGIPKPAPAIFEHALAVLAVTPSRAVHIGDEELDRHGAIAAGMRFEPVPLTTLPARVADLVVA